LAKLSGFHLPWVKVLVEAAIVMIIADGWDRGDPGIGGQKWKPAAQLLSTDGSSRC